MSRTLNEIMDDLSYGPLSNLSIGSSGDGSIPIAKQTQIVHLINRGLSKLHSRFNIYQRELYIRFQEGMNLYPLTVEAGESYVDPDPGSPSTKYIVDTVDNPFSADVIRILSVWRKSVEDPDTLVEIPINDSEADESAYTPASDIIQLPDVTSGEFYQIMYQASHPKLVAGFNSQIVYLPDNLYEALEYYVAYKVFSGMNGEEHRIKAADYYSEYQGVIQKSVDLDLVREVPVVTNTKLELRGFK